jgi:hypothetical protein
LAHSLKHVNKEVEMIKQDGTHTALWDAVCKTDPAHTKQFKKGGGFSGTAIKPYWLVRRATEVFGMCGIGWGWEEIENKMVSGVWCSKISLWFLEPGVSNPRRGEIEQWGQTEMESEREIKIDGNAAGNFRKFVDEEAPKKAVTDAVTKCLSYLGFAGDVHMGMFDDNKYVADVRAEFKEKAEAIFADAQARNAFADDCLSAIEKAANATELKTAKDTNLAKWNAMAASSDKADTSAWDLIKEAYNAKMATVKGQQPKPLAATVDSVVKGNQIAAETLGNDTVE